MSKDYKRAKTWINNKLRKGNTKEELLYSVGIFSNKSKQKVMAEKKITSEQYNKRYKFMAKVYELLS